jgi:hypothetical protein
MGMNAMKPLTATLGMALASYGLGMVLMSFGRCCAVYGVRFGVGNWMAFLFANLVIGGLVLLTLSISKGST